ncbi:RNA-binding protein [Candidatus Berkelbacteria bacterium CG_4_9_14_3_um_filter_39_23]|uniref:RNA-binding protein n=2 Tax=Candidatus Berkelbacteria TaxID=1618330 RepID=A0A2M7CI21_9BACT|nr:MAG: RNA-binding protein [Candidatus Berkelbacteria bacterium CG11_big_fil_rev_8_21_14_0_20_40_23]PIV25302.1 MAG: RNA-binding protein [Candidatus Berkelbacteria bacterium CG03_land_8_20_14_0_80_40_36]PIX30510.1 MAG: RNA-binding protein [Candidatus Berkelbacteria bacterium CG_4_8_14_3_um_filter_39_27]PIZ28870.1 MAG: RNA-binding protein [Candidatus Berkelbacteria bacterium CG_4_10_14_0_8_um_filter_39_42]PJB51651.1 MAG: RNA-binding protein [Candidatus Berkelbacteria bacterium CG_4_9_14_3_um_fil
MENRLFVGNLTFTTTEDQLTEMFAKFGEIVSARIITDKISGRSKGFGFVEYKTAEEAKAAIEGLNDTEIDGRKIVVNVARPMEKR